jgi:hypothetical protein
MFESLKERNFIRYGKEELYRLPAQLAGRK